MKTYTTAELMEITGLSRQALSNKRNGYKTGNGYEYEPELIEKHDWSWDRGKIVYYDTDNIKKLKARL